MDEHRNSPYLFRPILDHPDEFGYAGTRSRVSSGDRWPSQSVSSPTARSSVMGMSSPSGGGRGITAMGVNPKLLTCLKLSQETWSSTGSRHSSRPGTVLCCTKIRVAQLFRFLGASVRKKSVQKCERKYVAIICLVCETSSPLLQIEACY
jgi:hypothetical protein